MPTIKKTADRKEEELRMRNALNPKPEKVTDDLFTGSTFFDPRDVAQVRYEMLRRNRADSVPVAKAAKRFGFTRPTFYQVADAYDRYGIPGLIPRKTGPKGPRRCTPDIVDFARRRIAEQGMTMDVLIEEIASKFGTKLHRRTLERGLARVGKRGRRKKLKRAKSGGI